MTKPLRILITGCTYFPSRNGQAIFTINLAEGLAAQGHSVLVVVPKIKGIDPLTFRNGVNIIQTPALDLSVMHAESAMSLFPQRQVRKILDDFLPDIVHIHDHYPLSRSFVFEAKKRNIKVVGTNHFVPENLSPYIPGYKLSKSFLNNTMWKWLLATFNQLDFATAPSKTAAEILRGQNLMLPVFPISCGVDTHRFRVIENLDVPLWREKYGLDIHKPVILFVGRVDAEKNIEVLISAIKLRKKNDVQLVIAGCGAHHKQLKTTVEQLELKRQVFFPGFIPDEGLPSLINAVDIFCMPSEAELLSIASLEAMACGKPLLLANARALPELVSNGKNGYLFDPTSSRDAADKINLLLNTKDKWENMGAMSLQIVQTHTIQNTIAAYSMLYDVSINGNILPDPATEWPKIRPGGLSTIGINSRY